MKSHGIMIEAVTPAVGVPGGEVSITCRGFQPGLPASSRVLFGKVEASIISASAERVVIRLPENSQALGIELRVDGKVSPMFPFMLGARLAAELHPVADPVIAPDGAIITTVSGSRGQQIPQSLIRVSRAGQVTPYPCEILNPTGLAFSPEGQLYITSRAEGSVLRYANYEHLELVAEDLGIPCGIVFDPEGRLYVGDRTGKIHRIDAAGNRGEFASLPPSISAYHLAMDGEGYLYVTGPTLAMRDPVYRISRKGEVGVFLEGFARPQGLAFSPNGDLLLAASYGGRKGIFRYSFRSKKLAHHIAGPMLVGLALDAEDIFLVDGSSLFWIRTGQASGQFS
jgi:sugar lactone lactonase YvrE